MPLTEFQFGTEAIEYIRGRLALGNTLSKLAQGLQLSEGIIRAYLPSTLSSELATLTLEHGCREIDQAARESREVVQRFISNYLANSIGSYAVFEQVLARSTDPWIAHSEESLFTFKEEVYVFLSSGAHSVDEVKRVLSGQFVRGVLTTPANTLHLGNRDSVELEVLQGIVSSAEHLIIGAYDEATYLIWSRQG